jgi:hypothetical protein
MAHGLDRHGLFRRPLFEQDPLGGAEVRRVGHGAVAESADIAFTGRR